MSNSYPEWLQERAFGGSEVAVSPNNCSGEDSRWPNGPSVPGVGIAVEHLFNACLGQVSSPQLIFLVGGAGNGKSFMANKAVRHANAKPAENLSTFAKRSYRYETPSGQMLRVVNDATIPAESDQPKSLAEEISNALEQGEHLLACVNRGVLISEMHDRSSGKGQPLIIGELLDRLLRETAGDSVKSDDWGLVPLAAENSNTLKFEISFGKGHSVSVDAVFMDSLSLLERIPGDEAADREQVSNVRPILDGRRYTPRRAAFEKPLSELSAAVEADMKDGWPGGDIDPVKANVAQFENEKLSDAWCRCTRGAEIIEGSNFSYRDLWGLSALSLIGPSTNRELSQLSGWVSRKSLEYRSAKTNLERCKALLALAQLRAHVTLFGGLPMGLPLSATAWDGVASSNEATMAMRRSDPLLDMDPALSKQVFEILSYLQEGQPVGERLVAIDERLELAWSPLETQLDRAIADLVEPIPKREEKFDRSELLSWYAQYVVRLVGLSMGRPAFSDVLTEWQKAKRRADDGETHPGGILRSLMEVILPRHDAGQSTDTSSFLPILKPRVVSLGVNQQHVAMSVRPQDFQVDIVANGEKLVVKVRLPGADEPAETALDFHLLREALSRPAGQGFTDSLRHVEPRLERLRARILAMQLHGSRGTGEVVFVPGDGRLLTAWGER